MKLYMVTSPNVPSPIYFTVKAQDSKEASEIAKDVISENRMSEDDTLILYVTELVQPDNDGHGYCYPSPNSVTYTYSE